MVWTMLNHSQATLPPEQETSAGAAVAPGGGGWSSEVSAHTRFRFGKNWRRFLSSLDDDRIHEAERSLVEMLGIPDLGGYSFLDVGSGSGLFSLAAMRLGAREVKSFDYDPDSVACTQGLKNRFQGDPSRWTVEQGSVLDGNFMEMLGQWDIVYSWGVLHHTGRMIQAFDQVSRRVAPGGLLFIAIYNDQGVASARWRRIKRLFVSGRAGRFAVCAAFIPMFLAVGLVKDTVRGRPPHRRFVDYRKARGMSLFRDWLDWLGGYPFEVARPEEILAFFRERGFELCRLKTCGGGHGCNEFVFLRRGGVP